MGTLRRAGLGGPTGAEHRQESGTEDGQQAGSFHRENRTQKAGTETAAPSRPSLPAYACGRKNPVFCSAPDRLMLSKAREDYSMHKPPQPRRPGIS